MKVVLFAMGGCGYDTFDKLVISNEAKKVMRDHELKAKLSERGDDYKHILNRELRSDPRLVELAERGQLIVPDGDHVNANVVNIPEDVRDGWYISVETFNAEFHEAYPESDSYWETVEEPHRSWR